MTTRAFPISDTENYLMHRVSFFSSGFKTKHTPHNLEGKPIQAKGFLHHSTTTVYFLNDLFPHRLKQHLLLLPLHPQRLHLLQWPQKQLLILIGFAAFVPQLVFFTLPRVHRDLDREVPSLIIPVVHSRDAQSYVRGYHLSRRLVANVCERAMKTAYLLTELRERAVLDHGMRGG